MSKYIGIVIDRMQNDAEVYNSNICETWEQAHRRAESASRRKGGGDRFRVKVVELTPMGAIITE
jgi:hypothetical protein